MNDVCKWDGENFEEIIEVCGINNVVFNVDEQQLYVYSNDDYIPVEINSIITYTKQGIIVEN